jgi:hypothetical protein
MGIRYTHFLIGGKYVRIVDPFAFQGIYWVYFYKNDPLNEKNR